MAILKFTDWLNIRENEQMNNANFQKDFQQNIDQKLGANKMAGAAKVDPKAVINNATLQAAKDNPQAANSAVNPKDATGSPSYQKKKQKKK